MYYFSINSYHLNAHRVRSGPCVYSLVDFYTSALLHRAVVRSENLGVPVLFGGHNLTLLVEIGLTDLLKSGGAKAPRHPQGQQACFCKLDLMLFLG